jgi:GDPmannose 4,6-dehydratase
LQADARKARELLGWEPTIGFNELVALMVRADLSRLRHAQQSTTKLYQNDELFHESGVH